jgi:hypothetical protein
MTQGRLRWRALVNTALREKCDILCPTGTGKAIPVTGRGGS